MEKRSQRNGDECLARAVYATGSPLILTGNMYWKRFLNVLCPEYNHPTRHALSTHLLDAQFNRVQLKVKQIIEKADCIAIIFGGWLNVRGQGIINYIISTPQPVFYKSTEHRQQTHRSLHCRWAEGSHQWPWTTEGICTGDRHSCEHSSCLG